MIRMKMHLTKDIINTEQKLKMQKSFSKTESTTKNPSHLENSWNVPFKKLKGKLLIKL